MATYESLGVKRLINAGGYTSRAGGCCMSREVLDAMTQAAGCFVDMQELYSRSGEFIAQITGAEAGLVTSGAAGGLLLATAACITRGSRAAMLDMPEAGIGAEVVIQKGHRTGYDQAVRMTGDRLVEVGMPYRVHPEQVEYAINEKTVALLFIHGELVVRGQLVPLEKLIEIGKRRGVPVIVDAAVAGYPRDRLTQFVALGADLVVFSGAKHIGGPPGTGFLCGRQDLVEAARLQAGPEYGIGRPMKVSKEEIIGLITALERYVGSDPEAEQREWERKVRFLIRELQDLPHARVTRVFPDDVGRPVPRARIQLDERTLGITAYEVAARLQEGDMPVRVIPFNLHEGAVILNPVGLLDGDEELVVAAFRAVWGTVRS